MTYSIILMCICILYVLVGLFSPKGTEADTHGRVAFDIMFQSVGVAVIVEVVQWLMS